MGNSVETLLRAIGQTVWEIQITGTTAGDTLLDIPTPTTKQHRIYGTFKIATRELLEMIGTSTQGDAILFTLEQVDLTSQILYDDVYYEIEEEVEHNFYLMPKGYSYILRRKGAHI